MEKVDKYDPFYLKIDQRWDRFKEIKLREKWAASADAEGRPLEGGMPAPNISTHLWEANIGSNFPAGRQLIEVRAKDRYGRVFTDYATIRVVKE